MRLDKGVLMQACRNRRSTSLRERESSHALVEHLHTFGFAMRFSHLTLPSDWSTWRTIDTRSNNDGGGVSLDLGTFGLLAAASGRGGHAADRAWDAPTCPPQLAGVWMLPRQSISPLPLLTRAFQNPDFSAESGIYPDISGYIRWNLLAIQCESKTQDTAGKLTSCSDSSWKD